MCSSATEGFVCSSAAEGFVCSSSTVGFVCSSAAEASGVSLVGGSNSCSVGFNEFSLVDVLISPTLP